MPSSRYPICWIGTITLLLFIYPAIMPIMIAQAWLLTPPIPSALCHHRNAFAFSLPRNSRHRHHGNSGSRRRMSSTAEQTTSSSSSDEASVTSSSDRVATNAAAVSQQRQQSPDLLLDYDYTVPDDAVVHIKPAAMRRLRELKLQQKIPPDEYMTLRMGVRSGGCSGMSYVMDFCGTDSINAVDDQVDVYVEDKIQCAVDAKSMLYLFGLQLDYSTELIGGGFQFLNPNAEESCGCGSSFSV
jgi:iron-sulfur cluster assembly 1